MFELGLFLGVCALMSGIISAVDRFGGEQDYSG
jgi:uncharacterized membrane protein HdeD (DUF308 family)